MSHSAHYLALTQQNWGFVATEEQQRIASASILMAGCGLGSNIAVLAARTGFTRFVLADGDRVETSNLNRQAFRLEHVGRNKAEATALLIREVNPDAEIEVVSQFIQAKDAAGLVHGADLIVNLVDPGPALIAILAAAKAARKYTFFPLNVGFGGLLFTFGPDSPGIESLMVDAGDKGLFIGMLERLMLSLPPYLLEHMSIAERVGREAVPPPQLGVAVSLTAALVVTAMEGILTGKLPPLVPQIALLDSRAPAQLSWPVGR